MSTLLTPGTGLVGPRVADALDLRPDTDADRGDVIARAVKRTTDIAIAGVLVLVLLPLLVAVALAIVLADGGPVFYRQDRVGLNGRTFRMWKFRSMVVGADELKDAHLGANVNDGLLFKLQDDPRVTPVGRVLRRLAIDELPQLFNVVTGDMSLVGPRPLPVAPNDFDAVADQRHSVRPGITGPWQVGGANTLTYAEMVALDLDYAAHRSLRRDLWLLARTLPAVATRRGPY